MIKTLEHIAQHLHITASSDVEDVHFEHRFTEVSALFCFTKIDLELLLKKTASSS